MDSINDLFQRMKELQDNHIPFSQAFSRATLESKLKNWPSGWGDDLHVLLYGDFDPPVNDIIIESLGITICFEPVKDSVIRSAMTVLQARVKVKDHSLDSFLDAIQRLNTLCGIWTMISLCELPMRWSCPLMSPSAHYRPIKIDDKHEDLQYVLSYYQLFSSTSQHPKIGKIRQRLDAVLYWIRATQPLFYERIQDKHLLSVYSDFWNAFECLVDAVNCWKPLTKLTPSEKQQQIDKVIRKQGGKVTPDVIVTCHNDIVNPGFRKKVKHALSICFENDYEHHLNDCFTKIPEEDCLYLIRNAIDHGDIDTLHPDQLARVSDRLSSLKFLVLSMFSCFIPLLSPDRHKQSSQ